MKTTKTQLASRIAKATDDDSHVEVFSDSRDEACAIIVALLRQKSWGVQLDVGLYRNHTLNVAQVDEYGHELRPDGPITEEEGVPAPVWDGEAMSNVQQYLQDLGLMADLDQDSGVLVVGAQTYNERMRPSNAARAVAAPKPEIDTGRLDEIVETIKEELKSGKRRYWSMPFKSYVDERMGDLDWQGGGGDSDEDEDAATAYIMSKLPKGAK